MRNLLNFLAKYNNLLIFLILEGIAILLLTTGNTYHNTRLVKGIRGITRGVEERMSNIREYFNLREVNKILEAENVSLKNRLEQQVRIEDMLFFSVKDTVFHQQYYFSDAKITDNTVNRQKNFFMLNKGRMQGLSTDMAVVSGNSVAGVILGCSNNYSIAMSLLNIDFRLSARIKSNGYFGSLSWDGRDVEHAVLSEIPQHVTFGIGDTVETTGYSAVFPEGIIIGTVSGFEKTGGDFFRIEISLLTDFRKLRFVKVIGNMKKTEQIELEKQFQ
jgi:rod shape-determining protein MreC